MHYYWSWIIFYWRFLFACLKMDSPACWPETLGDSHWLRSSCGKPTSLKSQPWCRFGFPNVHQRADCVLPNPSCFGCLGCSESGDVQQLSWCFWLGLVCVLLAASSFLLNCEQETWCYPSQNGLRQNNVLFRSFSWLFFSPVFLSTLCKWNLAEGFHFL